MKIIPAIDIIGGQCVRLSEGDFSTKKVYYTDPLDAAKEFEAAGLQFLHLVDLDGARQGRVVNWEILEKITAETGLMVDFSGGISNREDIERALSSGAKQIAIGSLAVREPAMVIEWMEHFGNESVIIGADIKEGRIATNGWQKISDLTVLDFIERFVQANAQYFLCTDVSKDGRLEGPSSDLYRMILKNFPAIHLIASGGVSSIEDLEDLRSSGCKSAIVGKAIYEGRITLKELAEFT